MPHNTAPLKKVNSERLNEALDINPNPTLTMNQHGKIMGVNDRALECFGYESADEMIGKEIEILIPERYRGRHVHHRSGFFKEPSAREMGAGRDLSGLRKDGTEFPIEIGLKPFDTEEGVVVMGTIIDISERKRLEDLIRRQHDDLMELSTPVIRLWDGILVLPIVGKLDSERSRIMVEQLLGALSESGSTIAILDISGVPTVDTSVAQHLMKAIDASKLMGANCIVSGIRPEIANTIVNLGLDLSQVKTRSTMSRALHDAFKMLKLKVVGKAKTSKKKKS